MRIPKLPGLISAVLFIGTANFCGASSFILIDDMEGADRWLSAPNVGGSIVADPDDSSNQVYAFDDTSVASGAYLPLTTPIANHSTGTLFFRIRTNDANANIVWGASDVDEPQIGAPINGADFFPQYEGYGRISGSGVDVRAGGGFSITGESVFPGVWYNVWLVLDNTADQTTLYITSGSNDATNATGYSGNFRNGTAAALTTLLVYSDSGEIGYIDDVYVDPTGANLELPSPGQAPPSSGGFTLVDAMKANNWQSDLNPGGWAPTPDPEDSGNQVLAFSNVSATTAAYLDIPAIDDGITKTLFFRLRTDDANANFVWGASDIANPQIGNPINGASFFSQYEGYGRMSGGQFEVRDGGGFSSTSIDAFADVWYNVWLVLDNDLDQTTLYVTTGATDALAEIGLTGNFRNGTSDPLTTLLAYSDVGETDYIDDVFIADGVNLTLPFNEGQPTATFSYFEAENADNVGQPNFAPLQAYIDATANAGAYIAVFGANHAFTPPISGRAEYEFTLLEADTVYPWFRTIAPNTSSDSFWVRVNSDSWINFNNVVGNIDWTWDQVHDADNGSQRVSWSLDAGTHTLTVAYREAGTRLDRIGLTSDPLAVPEGPENPNDSDADGLPDSWELEHFGTLDYNDFDDPDGDGANNASEYQSDSDPTDAAFTPSDTDGDFLPDSWEIEHFGHLGYDRADDPDQDGVDNATEYANGTNPAELRELGDLSIAATSLIIGGNSVSYSAQGNTSDVLAFADKTRGAMIAPTAIDDHQIGVNVDKNGYELRSGHSWAYAKTYTVKGISSELQAKAGYGGTHKLLWQGAGRIRRNYSGTNEYDSATADTVAMTDPYTGRADTWFIADMEFADKLSLTVAYMDESQPLNADPDTMAYDVGHVRNFRLVHQDHFTDHGDGTASFPTFVPDFVAESAHAGGLRFMNWTQANEINNTNGDYTGIDHDRRMVPLGAVTYNPRNGRGGADANGYTGNNGTTPFIMQARLAAEIDAYWSDNLAIQGFPRPVHYFNIPIDVSDAAVEQIAQDIAAEFPAGATAYFELGNEIWNQSNSKCYGWCKQLGLQVINNASEVEAVYGYYAHRFSQVIDLVYAAAPELVGMVKPALGGWAQNIDTVGGITNVALQSQFTPASTPITEQLSNYGGAIAIGGYFGMSLGIESMDEPLINERILGNEHYLTLDEQARALRNMLLFGLVEFRFYDLPASALNSPVTGLIYDDATSISMHQLVINQRPDLVNGRQVMPTLADFQEMVRIDGSDLQFRPTSSDPWKTVATFLSAPNVTARQLYDDMQITLSASSVFGQWYAMGNSTILGNTTGRLKHLPVAENLGLPIILYEFGASMDNNPPGAEALYEHFLYESPYGVQCEIENARIYQAAGIEIGWRYKLHPRVYTDAWGAARWTGHWLNASDRSTEAPRYHYGVVEWNANHSATLPEPTAQAITINALPRELALYDATHDDAQITLSGTTVDAPDGAVVEMRARSVDDAGASNTAWQTAGTLTDGTWSGVLSVPLTDGTRFVAQARVVNSSAAPAETTKHFRTGHAIALWGQSEIQRFVLSAYNRSGQAPMITDETNLQVYWSENNQNDLPWGHESLLRGGPVTNATPRSAHAAALSNALASAYPGRAFSIALHARGGTSRGQSADQNNTALLRNWQGELNIRDLAFPSAGMRPGIIYESWFFNDLNDFNDPGDYVQRVLRFATGLNLDGTPQTTLPVSIHPDAYDASQGTYGFGMHRFDSGNETRIWKNIAGARRGMRDLFADNPHVPSWFVEGTDAILYGNGDDGNPAGDWAHPNTQSDYRDGMVRYYCELIAGAMRVAGHDYWTQPEFDHAQLAADRSYIEVWSSQGDIVTYRADNNETVPNGYPQIWGFQHNGVICAQADIVNGRVRIYPEGTSTFADGDSLRFLDAVGMSSRWAPYGSSEVLASDVWKDHPAIASGASPLLNHLPLRAATPASVLDVIPTLTIPPDDNPNPNLALNANNPDNLGGDAFVTVSPQVDPNNNFSTGWSVSEATWETPDGNGELRGNAESGNDAKGYLRPDDALVGKTIEVSFVLTSPDYATGELYLKMTGFGGGSTINYYVDNVPEIATALNTRIKRTITYTPGRTSFCLITRREKGGTGTVVLSDFAIREVSM